jgi:hypothetical protein
MKNFPYMSLEFLIAVSIKIMVFWDTLKREAAVSSRMLVPICQTTWCHFSKNMFLFQSN